MGAMDFFNDSLNFLGLVGPGKKGSYTKYARAKNRQTAQIWLNVFLQRAGARYTFEGLDDEKTKYISERVLVETLLRSGHASISEYMGGPENGGALIALPCTPVGLKNANGDYTKINVYGRDGYHKKHVAYVKGMDPEASGATAVYIRETNREFPFYNVCVDFALAVADTWRKLEVARQNAAVPFVSYGDRKTIESIIESFRLRDENLPFLFLDKGVVGQNKLEHFPIESTAEAVKVFGEHVEWLISEFDLLCGIPANSNSDKAERLNVPEVTANQYGASIMSRSTLKAINDGMDLSNELWGTHIRAVPYIDNQKLEQSNNAVNDAVKETVSGEEEEE